MPCMDSPVPLRSKIPAADPVPEAMVSNSVNALENTGGVLANNMGDGKMAFISRDDCAAAAAYAAMSDWSDRVVVVNGPELLTIADYLAIASDVTGRKVTYRYIDDEEQYAFFDSIGVPRITEDIWADTAKNFPFCSDGMATFGRPSGWARWQPSPVFRAACRQEADERQGDLRAHGQAPHRHAHINRRLAPASCALPAPVGAAVGRPGLDMHRQDKRAERHVLPLRSCSVLWHRIMPWCRRSGAWRCAACSFSPACQ